LQIWHLIYLLGPDCCLHKDSVRSFPQRGHFPAEKSSLSTGTTAPGANPLLMGEGYPLRIPTGQKLHQPQCSCSWIRGAPTSLFYLSLAADPAPSHFGPCQSLWG